ncbi:hypothetical protein E1265_24755 [Streptomyces sp. 8K308]|uniref:hypothetical protein n=1 Tax=Streptomyces sp. 8K308 TaxID=2530388 RepID=UPI00104D0B04|nr:hypothetical protein [Streptomyces sp. 8K308]TDC18808.1 hypothetical protein E1265_24755 [Streptomyces sp. 8K308]
MRIALSRSRLAAAAATLLLSLGLAATPTLARAEAQADSGPTTPSAPLTISPSSGAPNTSVTVRAACEPNGPATSPAFQQDITLRQSSNNQWVGTGRIKSSGLQSGRSYTVTVRCRDGVTLTTNFTVTSATPTGGAAAGFGGSSGVGGGDSAATALAVGGGVAVAGTAGYVFLARRRRATGSHY